MEKTQGVSLFHASAHSIDTLMRKVFRRLLSSSRSNTKVWGSRKGSSTEAYGALLELTNPRARISRSLGRAHMFSPLGELVWYLSGSNQLEQIIHYIPKYKNYSNDGTSLSGAYGPRIFEVDRRINSHNPTDHWQRIIDLLIKRGDTRNAVIQIFSNSDTYADNKDVPCTCTMQFAVRGKRLNLHVHMRSNDAVLGLPHDIFAFTMMQEIAARETGCRNRPLYAFCCKSSPIRRYS